MRAGIFLWMICLAALSPLQATEMEMEEAVPRYLYKVLSMRFWQISQTKQALSLPAEDHQFIHFSKEEQLDRLLGKYWADAPQFVVLKIDTQKLPGNLVYEVNPGGAAKYYHLYDGCIPIDSIVESKITYREPLQACCAQQNKLGVVTLGDAVLRQRARELSVEEILTPEIQELIEKMKNSMRAAPGVGLAAPQIGESLQIVVIEDMEHSHLTAQQLQERNRFKVPYHVLINPKLTVEEEGVAEFFEGCLSVPEMMGVVPRAKSVRVACLNEKGESVEIYGKGWYARILQHEIDHLHGVLYIDRAKGHTLTTEQNYLKLWRGKTVDEVLAILNLENVLPH